MGKLPRSINSRKQTLSHWEGKNFSQNGSFFLKMNFVSCMQIYLSFAIIFMENGMACNMYWESLCGCNLQSVNEWINELPLTDTWTNSGLFLVILTWKGARSDHINIARMAQMPTCSSECSRKGGKNLLLANAEKTMETSDWHPLKDSFQPRKNSSRVHVSGNCCKIVTQWKLTVRPIAK